MCKKIGIAAVAVLAGLLILNKTPLGNWAKFGWHRAKEAFNNAVPPEVEIAKLKSELANFGPKVKEHLAKMAEEKTEIAKLENDIKAHKDNLAAQEQKVRSCREEYETVKVKGGKTDLKAAILKREWNRYESGLKGLDAKERKLEVRKARFAAASEQLDAMTTMRVQLETKLEELEARLADLRLREAGDPVAFDDGQLGDIKEGISNLSDRISKMENLRDLEARYNDKVDGSSSTKKVADDDDLLRQIDDHFKPSKNGQKVAADRE